MRSLQRTKRNLLAGLVATVTATAMASFATAGGFEPIQRLGRCLGCGWGDGYHACNSSGCRPGADLPPRSYAKQYQAGCLGCLDGSCLNGSCLGCRNRRGGGFYDQFDSQFRSGTCDGGSCDDPGCDTPGCASAFDYARSRTYVAAGPYVARTKGCDSATCDSPGCDGASCDGASCDSPGYGITHANPWTAPQTYASQTYGPPTHGLQAHGAHTHGAQAPNYASPQYSPQQYSPQQHNPAMGTAHPPAATSWSPATPAAPSPSLAPRTAPTVATPVKPAPQGAKRPIRPTEMPKRIPAPNSSPSSASDLPARATQQSAEPTPSASKKPLRLPALGSSESEPSDTLLGDDLLDDSLMSDDLLDQGSIESLPAPKAKPESIPAPKADSLSPSDDETGSLLDDLGPLDVMDAAMGTASTDKLPEDWASQVTVQDPFTSSDSASSVSVQSNSLLDDSDSLLEDAGSLLDDSDSEDMLLDADDPDLLLFQSAKLYQPPSPGTRTMRLSNQEGMHLPEIATRSRTASYDNRVSPSVPTSPPSLAPPAQWQDANSAPASTRPMPPRSLFITQPQ